MKRISTLGLIVGLVVLLAIPAFYLPSAHAQPSSDQQISMDFNNVDIQVLIKFMSELTGQNFIVDKGVVGRVSVYSSTPISPEEALEVFSSVLQVNGFALVPNGKVTKIVPAAQAKDLDLDTVTSRASPRGASGRFMTQIIGLDHASAQEIAKAVTPLVNKGGQISAYIPANTLIISDYAGNIKRLLKIIRQLDRDMYGMKPVVYRLENGTATKVAEKVQQALQPARQGQPGTQAPVIIADDRINTVIVLAAPEDRSIIDNLMTALDVPTPKGTGDVHLVYLKNADAEEAAKVLMELVQRPTVDENAPKALSREIMVVADKATNSLIVAADPTEFAILSQTIEKLDVERKQVFVEALIMEVSSDQELSYGVNWATANKVGDGALFAGSQPGGGTLSQDSNGNLSLPGGGSIGYVKFPLTIGSLTFGNLQSIINLSKTNNDFKVLSTPQLLTLDNEEAKVTVAENIPYSTQINSGDQVDDKTTQSFDYRDVGVILTMTPQINEAGTVKLKINQQVSKVVDRQVSSEDNNYIVLAPTTRRREVDTTVLVRDGETIVIAGLLDRDTQESINKVPGLGDIPLLGNLFKYRTQKETQKNLLVFLTPRIVKDEQDVKDIYREKRAFMAEAEIGSDGLAMPAPSPLIMSGAEAGPKPQPDTAK